MTGSGVSYSAVSGRSPCRPLQVGATRAMRQLGRLRSLANSTYRQRNVSARPAVTPYLLRKSMMIHRMRSYITIDFTGYSPSTSTPFCSSPLNRIYASTTYPNLRAL